MKPAHETLEQAAERIYHEWDDALSKNDVEGLLALYAPDVIIETPLIPHLTGKKEGICRGKEELKALLEIVAKRKPKVRKFYRAKYFTDGKTIMWEYPRATPDGEQMDFVEIMEIENGLIKYHRVYWGWFGFKVINEDKYH